MGNRAAAELQNLLELRGDVQDAGQNLQRLEAQRNQYGAKDQEEAKFATPEAMATAVGASFILGPVGGLLMGVAQGILGKRERQNAIDQFNRDNAAYQGMNDVINSEFDRLAEGVTNDEDLAQLSTLQSNKDAAMKLLESGNPELVDQGMAMIQEVQAGMHEWSKTQETQRIEQEVRDAEIARDLNSEQQGNFQSLLDDYDAQSGNYKQTVLAGNQALELIERGNPVDIVAALIAVNKTLDPTSVVRPEEAKALAAGGDLLEQGMRKLNELAGSGLALSVEDRRQLSTLVTGLMNQSRAFQMQRDMEFQERAVTLDLPGKYVQHFRQVDDLPAFEPGQMQNTERQGAIQQTTAPIVEKAEGFLEGVRGLTTDAIEGVANWIGDKREERAQTQAFREEFKRIHGRYPTYQETNP